LQVRFWSRRTFRAARSLCTKAFLDRYTMPAATSLANLTNQVWSLFRSGYWLQDMRDQHYIVNTYFSFYNTHSQINSLGSEFSSQGHFHSLQLLNVPQLLFCRLRVSLVSFQVVCCLENNGCKTPKLVTQAVLVLSWTKQVLT